MKKPRLSSQQLVAQFSLANVGRVVTSREIQAAAGGAVQASRRLRELRERKGWKIFSHNDRAGLKPGEYVLASNPPVAIPRFQKGISARVRAQVLDRNGFTCQMCGITPGDTDPHTQRLARLHVGHIKDRSLGGSDEANNLRTLCSTCNQGAKNVTAEKSGKIWLLSQVRRAGRAEQLAVYRWLKTKFS